MACLLDYVDAPYNRRNPLRFSHGMLGIHNTDVFRNTRYLLRFRSDMCDDGNASGSLVRVVINIIEYI